MKAPDRLRSMTGTLRFYVVSSWIYAVLIYLGVELIFDYEHAVVGVGTFDAGQTLAETFTEHSVSFVVWIALSTIPAVVAHRMRRSLLVAIARVESVNRSQREFVSVVSHEFRTPLTSIAGFSEMIRDEGLTPEEVHEYANDINVAAHRLARLVEQVLDLDRMESGRVTLTKEPLDLNAVIRSAVHELAPQAQTHNIALELDPALPVLQADRDKITQVITNLVRNAVKYAPDAPEIRVTSALDGGDAHIRVTDHGPGLPSDALEKVFERYYRVGNAAERGIEGTGLGLPIVRAIVELHGGRTWAESELGKGATFHFTLPIDGATAGSRRFATARTG